MQQREIIFQNTEQKCRELTSKINKIIIKELEMRYSIKLDIDPTSEPIITLLLTPLQDDVIELLNKYTYQQPEIILGIIANLCNHNKYEEGKYIHLLSKFINIKKYYKNGNTQIVKTDNDTFSFQRFTDIIDDKKVIELITSGKCVNQCHTVAKVFSESIEDCNIVTSLMPGRYGGQYFHSYLSTEEDLILDIANNLITQKDLYYSYFQPKEIITYPSTDLLSKYNNIKEKSSDAETLQIALEHIKRKV